MKRSGKVLSLLATSGMMMAFGASLAHAGAVQPGVSTTSTASPTVIVTSANVNISTGTIVNTYNPTYFKNAAALDNIEQFTALSSQIPADLAFALLNDAGIVQNNPQLTAQLTDIMNSANTSGPTTFEFLTQNLPTEVAFATAPQNTVNFGTDNVVITPGLGANQIFANGSVTASQAVEDIAQATVGSRTNVVSGSQTSLGSEANFVISDFVGDTTSTGTATTGGLTFTQNTVTQQIIQGSVNVNFFQLTGNRFVSPIVLDVSGQGRLEASRGQWLAHPRSFDKASARIFDFYHNGFPVAMEWVGPHDGLLVEPKADGSVDATCLFGTQGGWNDGYQKLSLRDLKGDGKLTGDELKGLSVWVDANQDGVCQPSELKSVADMGISQININHTHYRSSFVMNGQSRTMWDWFPSAMEVKHVSAATARAELQADRAAIQTQQ